MFFSLQLWLTSDKRKSKLPTALCGKNVLIYALCDLLLTTWRTKWLYPELRELHE
jgi:hypothetical protein